MTFDDRVRALAPLGFTPRQTHFLVTVALHSGYCLRRQYAACAGLAYGKNVRAFLDTLVERNLARRITYRANRGHLYHLCARSIYRALRQEDDRHRRHTSPATVARRLMLLDAVLSQPNLTWLATEADKVECFTQRFGVSLSDLPRGRTQPDPGARADDLRAAAPPPRYFAHKLPIALIDDLPGAEGTKAVYVAPGLQTRRSPWLREPSVAPGLQTRPQRDVGYRCPVGDSDRLPSAEATKAPYVYVDRNASHPYVAPGLQTRRQPAAVLPRVQHMYVAPGLQTRRQPTAVLPRVQFVYLATEPGAAPFERFLRDHAALLRALPAWTVAVVQPFGRDASPLWHSTFLRVTHAVVYGHTDPNLSEPYVDQIFGPRGHTDPNASQPYVAPGLQTRRSTCVSEVCAVETVNGRPLAGPVFSPGNPLGGQLVIRTLPFRYDQFGHFAGVL